MGSTARKGGTGAGRTGGKPITITDFGLRNDGGLFSRRLSSSCFGQSQRRDVLILRGVCRAQNAGNIDDRSNIRTVVAAAGVRRGTDLRQQIAGRARGQGRDHGLAVRVIQHQLIGVLREARRLLGGGLVEALLIEADVQTARQ